MDFAANSLSDSDKPFSGVDHGMFHCLVDETPVSIFVLDRHGIVLYANPSFLANLDCATGYVQANLTTMLKDHPQLPVEVLTRIVEQGTEMNIPDFLFCSADGSQRILHITLKPFNLPQATGDILILGTAQEVTAQKQSADLLVQHAREIELLHSAGQKLSETLDLAAIYHTFLDLVARIMPHDNLFVSSYDAEQEMIHCRFAIIDDVEVDVSKLPPVPLEPEGMGLQSVVIRSGMPLLINDVQQRLSKISQVHYIDEQANVYEQETLPEDIPTTQSVLIVPLTLGGKTVGAIQVFSYQKHAFTEADLRILQALAAQIAVASNNALLFERAQTELAERKKLQAALEEEKNLLTQRVEERTSELIAANHELVQALRIKDEFLANMSHELRTPLNAILGMRESLAAGVYGALNPRQERPLTLIQQSAEHLLNLIADILNLTKIQAGKIECNPVPVQLEEAVSECFALVEDLAQKKQISLQFRPDESGWQVSADQRQLKQILLNLLSNAIKFSEAGSQVGVELVRNEGAGCIELIVWDTGIGIQPADIPRLFQPFVQLDSGLNRRFEGTGLGLALSARLAALNRGTISVESEGLPGKGSRFILSLPFLAAEKKDPLKGEADKVDQLAVRNEGGCLVLVAEDNLANLETVAGYLEQCGYQVMTAMDGLQAVELACREHPDLILMDIQLPQMDGLQAIQTIRQEPDLQATPIIALTALAMPGDKEKCLAVGADLYLSKPVRLRELRETIESELSRATPVS